MPTAAHPAEPSLAPADPAADLVSMLRERIGQEIGASPWTLVDQGRIDLFAQATGDHQFVHVDPVRAAETPFGGTIAHGYLTLAILGGAISQALPDHPGIRSILNLGAEKVRFLAPVRVNTPVRGVFVLKGVNTLPEGRIALRLSARVEARSGDRPVELVLTAELALMLILAEPSTQSPSAPRAPAGESRDTPLRSGCI